MKILLIILLASFGSVSARDANEEEWISLFDGETLEGWRVKMAGHELDDNFKNTFRAEGGVLKVSYDRVDRFKNRFGHIFFDQRFSYYRLRLEYRFTGEQLPDAPEWAYRNSGIMIHSQPPETMTREQDFPISIEVQLLGGDESGERPTANLCTPGTHVEMKGELVTQHCIQSSSKTYRGEGWVQVEVLVLGSSRIEHMVDGKTVLVYKKPQIGGDSVSHYDPSVKKDGKLLSSGYISLQSESHPVEFRNIELLNLAGCMDPQALNYKTYYEHWVDSSCEYR